ncbi:CDGSH iron-sulfur domain-containing protein 3, mitochondrial isoform X1 [Maniola hyperantus]|uniref:CDGSH iron-sulfur domain-containing protein 3, mitochondrial isoform X1 n=1 Tax=Aphantopus hyperantus TaxID=2795564 RepID=UPI0015689F72|nr:CDGSH iron-sulfur domain-containing protein 3, mitochondrial [Maniola hyperantus]XP_034841553.1 CDGSH iron-sulfur domain-containing protein 3, mitochondrial [Maniola hyperantus]
MLHRNILYNLVNNFRKSFQARYVTKPPKPEIPSNPLKKVYAANEQLDNGIVYDRKPFKLTLEEGKTYAWCLCGRSKSQPLCDGTHKDVFLKITQRPIIFKVEKTKDYWLCNCKQTKNRPFCDGTHKNKEVMEATTIRV